MNNLPLIDKSYIDDDDEKFSADDADDTQNSQSFLLKDRHIGDALRSNDDVTVNQPKKQSLASKLVAPPVKVPVTHFHVAKSHSQEFGSVCSQVSGSTLTGVKVSYDLTPFSSTLSSLFPLCRICQLPHEKDNVLITPCRCNGSLKHVHGTCLRKWIELRMRKKKTEFPARCELCGFFYRKHKHVKCSELRWPRMKTRDKVLHTVFLISLVVMIACAVVTVQCLISDSAQNGANKFRMPNDRKPYLTVAELTTLICGILFFVNFIIAMLVEIKAKHTIYSMFRRFIRYNTVWTIENYRKEDDTELQKINQKLPSKP